MLSVNRSTPWPIISLLVALGPSASLASRQNIAPEEPISPPRFNPHLAIARAQGERIEDEREGSLEISGQLQFRVMVNNRERPGSEDLATGFLLRRAKIKAKGAIADDRMRYTVSLAFNRRTGLGLLEDATIEAPVLDGLRFRVGQFRPNLLREESVSSKRQLAVERSLVARAFNQARVRGVELQHETERTRLTVAVMDASISLAGDKAWVYTARGELLVLGTWKQLKDFTSFRGDDSAVLLGASVGFFDTDSGPSGTPGSTTLRWSVDLSVETGGANLFAAFVGNRFEPDTGPALDQYGVVVQGGVFVSDTTELFARYAMGDDDDGAMLSLITVGATEYLLEHALKMTIDLGYGVNEVSDFWSSSGAGWLTDEAGQDGQFLLRAQMQLLF